MTFEEFNLNPELMEGISAMGYETATPIQEQAIPVILENRDIIASAQTGTGKTAAFLIPIINKIIASKEDEHIKALVIVPTRELAIQIDQHMEGFSYFTSVSSLAVFGGSDGSVFAREKQALTTGADVIIATPGRLIAHLNMNYVNITELEFLILDEADRMLDMGFHDDIMKIISYVPKKRQNLLFSATMPAKIRELARKVLTDPVEINIAVSKPAENVAQYAFVVYDKQKSPLVKYLLKAKTLRSILIFCSTKSSTKQLGKELKMSGFSVQDIHSDLDQKAREQALTDFKNRKLNILVATDILSRGIDIEDIDLVINYDIPNDEEDYIHRIGRTARAASTGVAFTFVGLDDQGRFGRIERFLGKPVPKAKVPDDLGETPDYDPNRRSPGKFHKGSKHRIQKSRTSRNRR